MMPQARGTVRESSRAMHRGIWIATALCVGCAAHAELRPLDDVTTTAATFSGRASPPKHTLESAYEDYEAERADAPTPLASTAPSDAQVAAVFETAEAAARARADLARNYARDPRVRALASDVYERMRDARAQLALLVAAPDYPVPPARLEETAGQSFVDFDCVYVDEETRQASHLRRRVDELLPFVTDVRVVEELMNLRPILDDLCARGFELERAMR